MAKQKLTPEFPPEIKPVHVGVYERDFAEDGWWFAKWNGAKWLMSDRTVEEANNMSPHDASPVQSLPWRGLAEQPKGSAK